MHGARARISCESFGWAIRLKTDRDARDGRFLAALRRRDWREAFFTLAVWFKGLDGLLEVIGGCVLLSVGPDYVLRVVECLTQDEIVEDPHDYLANALLRAAAHLSVVTEHFVALYLLINGLVKLGLVWALLERVLVAYPLAIAIFGALGAYQLYRYTLTHAPGLLVLSAVDAVVIAFVFLEYRALRRTGTVRCR
jgi:uncharacterized membrane protein